MKKLKSDSKSENYAKKLKDPRWQRKRLEVLNRDDWCCQLCGDKSETLHVHHKEYRNPDPWDSHMTDLITLCESCHEHETYERFELEKKCVE